MKIQVEHYLEAPQCRGPRGGIRVSYQSFKGQYLRETEFVKLIESGYIGTHSLESEAFLPIIEEMSKGDKMLIVAWEKAAAENNR